MCDYKPVIANMYISTDFGIIHSEPEQTGQKDEANNQAREVH